MDSLQDFRDVSIIAYTIAGTVVFLLVAIFTIAVGSASFFTIRRARRVLAYQVEPTLENVRETTSSVRSTVTFISDNAVTPVVRTYGIIAGARRFLVVVGRFTRGSGE
jgi:hypothetical protein